ncbi:MAG: ATP-binding cassette domain-containing protein [Saccharolobus sp.]|uniref:Molybdate/tungstate import ATP-binding protein WtpC n=2 Tax=Saccharolobus TaxID=2100760 RepID=A0A8F5BRM2_SACSH|nr:ATP-binding cassette domain-containing protein [Saccharolobus shibatae]MCH4814549.1 ATP-binding cassette domain-containing protein [Saccharolobus shibatae]QXJ30177.1 putative ABC transporter, ATP-binding protein [Saccharolobus shibatae B12]
MIEVYVKKRLQAFLLNVNFSEKGIIAITGKNGSGKSTLLNVIAGILKPDEGYVKLNNIDITNLPINKRSIVLVTPESYIPTLDLKKHLTWGAKLKGRKVDDKEIMELAKLLGVPDENKKVGNLSLGNKEKVSLVTAILTKPNLILVDEGFSNISEKEHFINVYVDLCKKNQIELIYVTQDTEDAKFSDHHYVMNNGSLHKVF